MIRIGISTLALLALGLLLCGPRTAHAAESYDGCAGFITSVPTVISAPGTWCLKQDLSSAIGDGIAIDLQADNAAIDCKGFKIDNSAAGIGTSAIGIYADSRSNITVRHCNVRGFNEGIELQGHSGGHLIENNLMYGNTYVGIDIYADGAVVRRNRVLKTGQSTQIASAYGIRAGNSVDVLNNTVVGVIPRFGGAGEAAVIYVVQYDSSFNKYPSTSSTSGNRVRGVVHDDPGSAYGIYFNGIGTSDHLVMRNNDLVGDGGTSSIGLACNGLNPAYGLAKANVIKGFAVSISSCGDAGGNDLSH